MISSTGYSIQGHGTPVVALHSSMSSKTQWKQLAERLAPDYRFLAIDLSGYGRTPFPSCVGEFSLHHEAAIADEVIRAELGDEPFHLIGHSYGGGTALRLAHEHPQRVRTLSVYEPTPFCLLDRDSVERAELQTVIDEIASRTAEEPEAATRLFIDYWNGTGSFALLPAERRNAMVNRIEKVNLDFHALVNDPLTRDDCRGMRFPVCLIAGKKSVAPPRRIVDVLFANLPHAIRYDIDAGHMGPITHADEVNDIVCAFLDHHERRAALAAVGY